MKAVRKTRTSQAPSSQKLARLQQELAVSQELARGLCQRETLKRDLLASSLTTFEQRVEFATLKRKYPSLSVKEDDELFIDREFVPKRPRVVVPPQA